MGLLVRFVELVAGAVRGFWLLLDSWQKDLSSSPSVWGGAIGQGDWGLLGSILNKLVL